jgi:hypothetical protein
MTITLKIGGLIAIILLLLVFPQVYFITDSSGASLWRKGEHAYLFLGDSHRGVHVSYLGYPWARVREYFYAPPVPQDHRIATEVTRITPESVEQWRVSFGDNPGDSPQFLTPFDQGFFALCPGLVLCKWAGKDFKPATAEEAREIGGIDRLVRGPIGDEPINGWTYQSLIPEPGAQFTVDIGGKFSLLVKNKAQEKLANAIISVDLLRPGRQPENLYDVDGTPHRVSRKQYERIFARH